MTTERRNKAQEWEAARTVTAAKQAHSWTTHVAVYSTQHEDIHGRI